jgi:hypothetical protein
MRWTAARNSKSGSLDGSMPSTRGIGSKMRVFCWRALSGAIAVSALHRAGRDYSATDVVKGPKDAFG